MTPDEIEAERERFEAKYSQTPIIPLTRDESGFYNHHITLWVWTSWLYRAEIARAEQAELMERWERANVQLAGCLTAADGHTTNPAKQGDYGWSLPYQRILELWAENERLRQRVRELAKKELRSAQSATMTWERCRSETLWKAICKAGPPMAADLLAKATDLFQLAEEAGVWFDDQGNEVPLAEWRARMGGAE